MNPIIYHPSSILTFCFCVRILLSGMIWRQLLLTCSVLLLCTGIFSQSILSGKIYDIRDSLLPGVTVFNPSLRIVTKAGADGTYSIAAAEGDKVVFSIAGYETDTLTVQFHMLLTTQDITLKPWVISLKAVTIRSSYREDSLRRRNEYEHIYKKQPGITGRNTPSSGFGVSLSPLSYFSSASKQKRQLKKRLIKYEREDFIDRSFPLAFVERVTQLHGDSLRLFMYRYRPSYEICRASDGPAMLVYINEKLKEFRKPGTE